MLPILPLASRWFVSPDPLSSSRSIGSWPGGYVGSNWNGWTPLITLNRYFLLKQMLRGDPKVDAISTRYCAIASLPHTLRHNMPLTVKMSPRWSGPKGAKTKTSNRFFEQKIINQPEERAKLIFFNTYSHLKKKYKNGRIFYFSSPLRTTTTTLSTTTGSELLGTAQAQPVNFVVVVSSTTPNKVESRRPAIHKLRQV